MEKIAELEPHQWVNRYANALYSYTVVRVNDVGTAEDIVQDTFLNAWKARDSYNGEASEKNWLYTICRNRIIDHHRKNSKRADNVFAREENEYFDDVDHWTKAASPKDWNIDYTQRIDSKEFYSVLDGCKRKMKDIQQTVFVMKYMDDIQSEEICKFLDLKPSYYWVLIHRAKLHLRSCL